MEARQVTIAPILVDIWRGSIAAFRQGGLMGESRRTNKAVAPAMLLVCLSAAGLLSSCDKATPEKKPKAVAKGPCLPGPARGGTAATEQPRSAHVYLDRSQSMSGYVHPSLGRSQALADLLRLLERQLPTIAPAAEYRAFGAEIGEPLQPKDVALFSAPDVYNCRSCDNQESHIDEVLDEIARAPKEAMHLVVTDLWLDNRSFRGSDEVALGEPLRDILRSGRALGLVGIRAPFHGPIYKVPGAGTYGDAQERPLFLLMVGPADSLALVHRRLAESQSSALAPDRLRFSLYSPAPPDPAPEGGVRASGRGAGPYQVLRPAVYRQVPQFRLALDHAEQGRGALEGNFAWAPQAQPDVWQGDLIERTRVWRLPDEDRLAECSADTWVELPNLRGTWRPAGEPGRFKFSVDHRLRDALPPGTYYLLGELGARGLSVPNPQTGWMEEWSLAPNDAAAFVQQRPTVFKALNLGRFRTILDEEFQRQRSDRIRLTRRTGFLLRLEP
jgi:hypothetical protein